MTTVYDKNYTKQYVLESNTSEDEHINISSESIKKYYLQYLLLTPEQCNENELIDKFKTICISNFKSLVSSYGYDPFYLKQIIDTDMRKYLINPNFEYLDVEYHPINTCFILKCLNKKYESNSSHFYQTTNKSFCYIGFIYVDQVAKRKIENICNFIFNFKYNNSVKHCVVMFGMDATQGDIIYPNFIYISDEMYEKYKKTIEYIDKKHPEYSKLEKCVKYSEELF